MKILDHIALSRVKGQKLLAQLIDPDAYRGVDALRRKAEKAVAAGVDFFFLGGSLITKPLSIDLAKMLRELCGLPVVLFPSSPLQVNLSADALLFLSLISGRNPEYLIGQHVIAAPLLRHSTLEVIPTGYMLVDCGAQTTASYISGSMPLPYHKPDIAGATALAGELLGMKLLYLDGGSGAPRIVNPELVKASRDWSTLPLVVGGGITGAQEASMLYEAGADLIVVGTAAEHQQDVLTALALAKYG